LQSAAVPGAVLPVAVVVIAALIAVEKFIPGLDNA
jgi:hypothetical protein